MVDERPLNKTTSLYLDVARFTAAAAVVNVHANAWNTAGGISVLWRLSTLGNDAVMVFFVLSGLVIAYVAERKEHTLREFTISRMARLYSVVVPALLLTALLDPIGAWLAPEIYWQPHFPTAHPLLTLADGLLFTGQLWFKAQQIYSNIPFWSLGYEAPYYLLFAIAWYVKAPVKWLLLLTAMAVIGPKILLLYPVWILGIWSYRQIEAGHISERTGWLLFIGSSVLYLAYHKINGPSRLQAWSLAHIGRHLMLDKLTWSQFFLSSYIIGALVSMHFLGFSAISHRLAGIMKRFDRHIRSLSSYTFASYLLHFPLFLFFAALWTWLKLPAWSRALFVVGPSLVVIWALGGIAERQKGLFHRRFTWAWDLIVRWQAARTTLKV